MPGNAAGLSGWHCRPLGEAALLLEAAPPTPTTHATVFAVAAALEHTPPPGLVAVVPGIGSLLVRFDVLTVAAADIERQLLQILDSVDPQPVGRARIVSIPVVYGGGDGPDLDAVAALLGLTPDAVIAEHCRHVYDVLMIGFAPGFPYIGPVPASLTVPRRATPRAAVPAGSVALAAGLTGIYPARLPGGWHIIGRTRLRLFDPSTLPPTLLQAGDGVRFEAVAAASQP